VLVGAWTHVHFKSADLVCTVFGPHARHGAPGHEEIELALVKLDTSAASPYRSTPGCSTSSGAIC
jgi:DUF1680 family protein